MAWQEVETDVGAKIGRVKYSVALKHGGARISVPKHVLTELGWTKATCFRLMVGAGESDGKLKLEPMTKGRIVSKAPPSGEGLIIRLGRWTGLAPRDVEAIAVAHEIIGNALVVSLPRHARNEAPPAKPTSGSAPTRDVTTQITGRDGNGGRPISRAPGT